MTLLAPDMSRTAVVVGDTHIYAPGTSTGFSDGANERANQFQDRVLALGNPAAVLHIGDLTEDGLAAEAAVAGPWWNAWPDPKAIVVGNHDIDNAGGDTLPQWEARYGDRTQLIDTAYFRVVTALWSSTGQADPRGLNTAQGLAELDDLIGDSTKPTALAFHYATRTEYGSSGTGFTGSITAAAEDNVQTLIDNHDHLQLFFTGHTHPRLWMGNMGDGFAVRGNKIVGNNGREVIAHNVFATTYLSNLGNRRSQLVAPFFSFYSDRYELRLRDIKADAWMPRAAGEPLVEEYLYT